MDNTKSDIRLSRKEIKLLRDIQHDRRNSFAEIGASEDADRLFRHKFIATAAVKGKQPERYDQFRFLENNCFYITENGVQQLRLERERKWKSFHVWANTVIAVLAFLLAVVSLVLQYAPIQNW